MITVSRNASIATEHIQHVEDERTERWAAIRYEDFLRTTDTGIQAEWVDGEKIVFSLPTDPHQDVLRFLATLIDTFVELLGLGDTQFAPYEVRLYRGAAVVNRISSYCWAFCRTIRHHRPTSTALH
jgi:hypothetical protein